MNNYVPYPAMPANLDESVIKPSETFRKSIIWATFSMLFFILTYLLVLAASLAIAIASGIIGIGIISAYPSFMTLALGGGLIISGIMLLYFLIKFMFKKQYADYSGMVEVTDADQPDLFHFIRSLTIETGSPFPKHVFITPNVNAGVFYDSTFWSMFLPVKKNLQIGLGLVNSLNISEFKSVMAHEFGHFSQRSMKFGSYVYNMNRIIYNMLYDNEDYHKALNRFARMHVLIRLGIMLNVYMVRGIQQLLKKVYVIVNKSYLKLSREMEFHADAVAAYVAGSNQCINSLRTSELSQICYNNLFNFLNTLTKDKQRPDNLYPHHITAMQFFAETQQFSLGVFGVPIIDKKLPVLNNTRIVIQDQWSSHPSHGEREERLQQLNIKTTTVESPAWDLFTKPLKLQEQLTDLVYQHVDENYQVVDNATITLCYTRQNNERLLNNKYKGYYNNRFITAFEPEEVIKGLGETPGNLAILFNNETCNLPQYMEGLQTDISTVEFVDSNNEIKTFDYIGTKYKKKDAGQVKAQLEIELKKMQQQLETTDKQLFHFFYHQSSRPEQIIAGYKGLFDCQKRTVAALALFEKINEEIKPIFSTMKYDAIEATVARIYDVEKDLKEGLRVLIDDEAYKVVIKPDQQLLIENYLSKNWIYFSRPVYNDPAIDVLTKSLTAYHQIITDFYFLKKKQLTDLQLELME